MSTISIHRTELLRITHNRSRIFRQRFRRNIPPWRMTMMNLRSSDTSKKEELSVKISKTIPQVDQIRLEGLRFDRVQPPEVEFLEEDRLEFGKFVAREAMLDEEYWTAAWLRAESHWEDRANERYVDNFKRKFAEQEFNAIKRRCKGLQGQKCSCIVAVKKEERHIKRSVIKSVVGTLDLSIRFFLHGETFPGEKVKSQLFCSINGEGSNRYGYIANLCVEKSARRQGIACNMLSFAVESARLSGVEQVYVHVHRNNSVAQELYQNTGFEIVETGQLESSDDTYLLQYPSMLILSLHFLGFLLENGREESRRRRVIDDYVSWLMFIIEPKNQNFIKDTTSSSSASNIEEQKKSLILAEGSINNPKLGPCNNPKPIQQKQVLSASSLKAEETEEASSFPAQQQRKPAEEDKGRKQSKRMDFRIKMRNRFDLLTAHEAPSE